jgi:hypothetical protein
VAPQSGGDTAASSPPAVGTSEPSTAVLSGSSSSTLHVYHESLGCGADHSGTKMYTDSYVEANMFWQVVCHRASATRVQACQAALTSLPG